MCGHWMPLQGLNQYETHSPNSIKTCSHVRSRVWLWSLDALSSPLLIWYTLSKFYKRDTVKCGHVCHCVVKYIEIVSTRPSRKPYFLELFPISPSADVIILGNNSSKTFKKFRLVLRFYESISLFGNRPIDHCFQL